MKRPTSVVSLIAFTSGLDSTYLLDRELRKGNKVQLVYADVAQGIRYGVVELLARREIINYYKKKWPDLLKVEWITPKRALDIAQYTLSDDNRRIHLVQQCNTMMALVQVIIQADSYVVHRPMAGWHHEDVLESDPNELASASTITLYKSMFQQFVRSVDPERVIVSNLLTPCWDVSKYDMYNSLPDEVKHMITLGAIQDVCYDTPGKVKVSFLKIPHSKYSQYMKEGCNLDDGDREYNVDILTGLDRCMIACLASSSCNYEIPLVVECYKEFKQYIPRFPRAITATSLSDLISMFGIADKTS